MGSNFFNPNGKIREITNLDSSILRGRKVSARNKENLGKPKRQKSSKKGTWRNDRDLFHYFVPMKRVEIEKKWSPRMDRGPVGDPWLSSPMDSNGFSFELTTLESSLEELSLSVNGQQFTYLNESQKDAFLQTLFQKLENDSGRGYKYGGFDTYGALRTVSGYTVSSIVSLLSSLPQYCHISLLDCRSEQEYERGHIKYAIRVIDEQYLKCMCEQMKKNYSRNPKRFYIFIFYCEFSSKRGPSYMKKFMSLCHADPVFLDNVYILDGGYKAFYELFKGFCKPMGYLEA